MNRSVNGCLGLFGAIALAALLASCGGSGSPGGGPADTSGMLRQVRDAQEFENALKSALSDAVSTGLMSGPIALPTVTAADFSSTYTLEAGVDELDLVRFDGSHLYVATEFSGLPELGDAIRILRTDRAGARATEVSRIPLDPGQMTMGMYVADGRLFLVSSEAFFGPYGGIWPAIAYWAPTRFTVRVYDVRNPESPRELYSATLDGVFVASRRTGDRVVLVSRHSPRVLLDETRRQRIERLPLHELLPSITVNGRKDTLVDARDCYITNDDRPSGYPIITSITSFSLSDPRDNDSICYDEATDGVYASRNALYVSEPRYSAEFNTNTRIHKFSLQGARASYAGSAEVPGALWLGGQMDFRMSESAGLLRVMTTEPTTDTSDSLDHRLFVLRPKQGELALEIIGRLPSDTRPQEIGKPNEGLFGVRFDGDRAYAVTFQRIDPLYVIDLSTPSDPRIAGDLVLPGVSEFLHPVTGELLLGLGIESGHTKLELYDTSVLELPQSRGAITLGGLNSYSPALYDRHNFTYLAGPQTDRFAIPAILMFDQSGNSENTLHQFEVLGKSTPASSLLQEAGVLELPESAGTQAFSHRSFIDGDTVYYVRDGLVWSSNWSTPSQVNGPF